MLTESDRTFALLFLAVGACIVVYALTAGRCDPGYHVENLAAPSAEPFRMCVADEELVGP